MPSPAAQSHAAVDAVEVVLNASNGVFEHLDVVEAAAVPRLFYTPSDSLYNSYQKQDMQSTNVDEAWDTGAGSERVVVQAVDSGVFGDGKGEHPDAIHSYMSELERARIGTAGSRFEVPSHCATWVYSCSTPRCDGALGGFEFLTFDFLMYLLELN